MNHSLPETTWEITLDRAIEHDAAWRARLIAHIRPQLERKLETSSDQSAFAWDTPVATISVKRITEPAGPTAPLKLVFALPETQVATGGTGQAADGSLPRLYLPDAQTHALRARLVGLEPIIEDVCFRFRSQWDGEIERWGERTASVIPAHLYRYLATAHSLFVFHGDPGLGKSATAIVIADAYTREQQISGTVLFLTTEARGNGLVGDFSSRLHLAFKTLTSLPEGEFRCLLIDEADALAVRRSEAHAHHEDRAGTASLLQALDSIAGLPRTAVILTTNCLTQLDPALLRRAVTIGFERPNQAACRILIERWLPEVSDNDLSRLARAAHRMTPADIDQALSALHLTAIREGGKVTVTSVAARLRKAPRTGAV